MNRNKTGDLVIRTPELPPPGEAAVLTVGQFEVLVENTAPPNGDDGDRVSVGDVVAYVPVAVKSPNTVVQHAAAVFQRDQRTRVDRYTLCSRSGSREVARRLTQVPLAAVSCSQCRARLVDEGLIG